MQMLFRLLSYITHFIITLYLFIISFDKHLKLDNNLLVEVNTIMRIVGIGDLLIPASYIEKGFKPFKDAGWDLKLIDWKRKDIEELQNINLKIEQGGSEAFEVEDYIIDKIKDADVIITQFCPINKKVIDSCHNLKAVGVLRGGYENINVEYCTEKGIMVFNTPGRNANAVADFTVAMILCEARNIARAHALLKEGHWVKEYSNKDSVPDMCDKTVGIIGYGAIGKKVAQRLKAFDMHIIVYDPYLKDSDVESVSLEELFERSDFVTIHSRLTKENEKMVNYKLLSKMKPTAYFINMARSGLVDEDDLDRILEEKKIAGAAIDVFEVEPPGKDYKFMRHDNVTVTPHMAGTTKDAFTYSPVLLCKAMYEVLINNGNSNYLLNGKV